MHECTDTPTFMVSAKDPYHACRVGCSKQTNKDGNHALDSAKTYVLSLSSFLTRTDRVLRYALHLIHPVCWYTTLLAFIARCRGCHQIISVTTFSVQLILSLSAPPVDAVVCIFCCRERAEDVTMGACFSACCGERQQPIIPRCATGYYKCRRLAT